MPDYPLQLPRDGREERRAPEPVVPVFDAIELLRAGVPVKPEELRQKFESDIKKADSKDFAKTAQLLTDVSEVLRAKELGGVAGGVRLPEQKKLDAYSVAELRILQTQLEQVVQAPRVLRETYASLLVDDGDLAKAQKVLKESLLVGGSREGCPLHDEVEARLKRQSLAGGVDPLELARLASRELGNGNADKAGILFDRARVAADSLNPVKLSERLAEVDKQIAEGKLDYARTRELYYEKAALGDLVHSPAAVDFAAVQLAVVRRDFGEAQNLLARAARRDPDFVTDRQSTYLDMLTFVKSGGKQTSVFDFQNELLSFQRNLSPANFDPEAAKAALKRAQEAVKELPAEEIARIRKTEQQKTDDLELRMNAEGDPTKKLVMKQRLEAMQLGLSGLEMLEHAPAFCKLMEGVFELANKRTGEAKAIFDEVEKMDPEYGKKATTQLDALRKMADLPELAHKQETWWKGLLREIGYSAAAIGAGALVVVATGWSGPAALGAGFATGAAVRSGLKYAVEGDLQWYDPLIGGIDGLSGGAGSLARTAALNRLANGGRALGAAERALAATGLDAASLEGLQGLQRLNRARELSSDGLKVLGKDLSWAERAVGSGGASYREASGAVRALNGIARRGDFYANLLGAGTTSSIFRGRQAAQGYYDGQFDTIGGAAKDFGGNLAGDVAFTGIGSSLLRPFGPTKYMPLLYGERDMALKYSVTEQHLKEIEALVQALDAPSNPQQVRDWYLQAPGPKVELITPLRDR